MKHSTSVVQYAGVHTRARIRPHTKRDGDVRHGSVERTCRRIEIDERPPNGRDVTLTECMEDVAFRIERKDVEIGRTPVVPRVSVRGDRSADVTRQGSNILPCGPTFRILTHPFGMMQMTVRHSEVDVRGASTRPVLHEGSVRGMTFHGADGEPVVVEVLAAKGAMVVVAAYGSERIDGEIYLNGSALGGAVPAPNTDGTAAVLTALGPGDHLTVVLTAGRGAVLEGMVAGGEEVSSIERLAETAQAEHGYGVAASALSVKDLLKKGLTCAAIEWYFKNQGMNCLDKPWYVPNPGCWWQATFCAHAAK